MKKNIIWVIPLFFLLSCKGVTQKWMGSLKKYAELKYENGFVQIMNTSDVQDTTILKYRIRIIQNNEEISRSQKQLLWYQMDSCFYLQSSQDRYLPEIVEPIANGINNCQEYLVEFKIEPEMIRKDAYLVYQDKHLSNRTISLLLSEK